MELRGVDSVYLMAPKSREIEQKRKMIDRTRFRTWDLLGLLSTVISCKRDVITTTPFDPIYRQLVGDHIVTLVARFHRTTLETNSGKSRAQYICQSWRPED